MERFVYIINVQSVGLPWQKIRHKNNIVSENRKCQRVYYFLELGVKKIHPNVIFNISLLGQCAHQNPFY